MFFIRLLFFFILFFFSACSQTVKENETHLSENNLPEKNNPPLKIDSKNQNKVENDQLKIKNHFQPSQDPIKREMPQTNETKISPQNQFYLENLPSIQHPFLRNRKYLLVYSSKKNTTVPELILPRLLESKVGYQIIQNNTRGYYIEYYNPYLSRALSIPIEGEYILGCQSKSGKHYRYTSHLTSSQHLCYLTKSKLFLTTSHQMTDSFNILAKPHITNIYLIHKKEKSYRSTMLRKKDPGFFIFYDIYQDRKYFHDPRYFSEKKNFEHGLCLSICQARNHYYKTKKQVKKQNFCLKNE